MLNFIELIINFNFKIEKILIRLNVCIILWGYSYEFLRVHSCACMHAMVSEQFLKMYKILRDKLIFKLIFANCFRKILPFYRKKFEITSKTFWGNSKVTHFLWIACPKNVLPCRIFSNKKWKKFCFIT